MRAPKLKIALMSEWEAKIKAIVEDTMHRNIVSLSGVPSWMMTLIKRIFTGKRCAKPMRNMA